MQVCSFRDEHLQTLFSEVTYQRHLGHTLMDNFWQNTRKTHTVGVSFSFITPNIICQGVDMSSAFL